MSCERERNCMKKRMISAITGMIVTAVCLSSCGGTASSERETIFAFDTYMTFTVYGDKASEAIAAAKEKVAELESLWSPTDENSEIYRINHRTENTVELSDETSFLLETMLGVSEMTDGALDPTLLPLQKEWGFISGEHKVPEKEKVSELLRNTGCDKISLDGNKLTMPEGYEIDVGAAGKGRAADIIADCFTELGVKSAVIDLGGNILTVGEKPGRGDWKVGIRNPYGDGTLGTVQCGGCAVVTSGNYERYFVEDDKLYHHILDPKTGYPAENGIISITVIGDNSAYCDALSTALFVMGTEKAAGFLEQHKEIDAIFVSSEGILYLTEGAKDMFTFSGGGIALTHIIKRS